ncbi:MAG TPA: hypothetical protein VM163_05400 [bacterium]|nr:hypothetical protein [bacterium]
MTDEIFDVGEPLKQALVVVMASENGRDGWVPIPPEVVPEWVKEHGVMGRIVAGDVALHCGLEDSLHYRAATDDELRDLNQIRMGN